jgi:type IV secretion system protein VirB10
MSTTPSSPNDSLTPTAIHDRTPRPPGVLPRHLQTWFVAGIAGLVMLVVLATGRQAPPRQAGSAPKPPAAVDANQVRIQEYRDRIDEQVRRLQAEQADLAITKQVLSGANAPARTSGASGPAESSGAATSAEAAVEQDRLQRSYRALYADNVAWKAESQGKGVPASLGAQAAQVPSALPPAAASPTAAPAAEAGGPRYVLQEGTLIDAVLTNRLDGSAAGLVNAMVTAPVYARGYQLEVIPRGSRLLGTSSPVTQFGQQRLAVAFHRLIFPDGRSQSLDRLPALNQRGDGGLKDQVNQHLLQIFGTSLAIGALAGLAQVNTGLGYEQSWGDAYWQGVGSSVTQSSMRILDRFLNQLPTVTIREGHRLKVYLTADLSLPAYRSDPLGEAVQKEER